MQKTGIAELPLHYGKAPAWLVIKMRKLAHGMVTIIVDEYGQDELLRRLSDPFWFQAIGCVLGYDFHSSGVTTVVTGVLKHAIKPQEHGLAVAGGKGKVSLQTPLEIEKIGTTFEFSEQQIHSLKYASRMSAKIDNSIIQSGYSLYHHAFFVTETGKWVVIQQGMNIQDKTARRYHWLSDHVKSFVNEPHDAIVCDVVKENVLNMTAKESEGSRKVSVDLAKEGPGKVKRNFTSLHSIKQKTLKEWVPEIKEKDYAVHTLYMPRDVNWDALKRAYDIQPRDYEELIALKGIGPKTVRALALISELVYGDPPSWKDPCKYSFCVGGKDGLPHPIDRKTYSEIIQNLEDILNQANVGNKEKIQALKRLKNLVPSTK